MISKEKLLLSIIITCFFFSCSKDPDSKCAKTGTIIGYDMAMCVCCGGILVDHEGETLRFYSVPNENEFSDWAAMYGFPITIAFDYKDTIDACADYHKIMTCMELLEHNECTEEGLIINYRSQKCLCCPGWVIVTGIDTIKVETLPNEGYFRDIIESNGFPVAIKFNYEETHGTCSEFYERITCIEINH